MPLTDNILHDDRFKLAVTAIQKRAERQIDDLKLLEVFVATDMFTRSKTSDTQLILGRRGTGKTHMIKAFAHAQKAQGNFVILIDCTQLGSGLSSLRNVDRYET